MTCSTRRPPKLTTRFHSTTTIYVNRSNLTHQRVSRSLSRLSAPWNAGYYPRHARRSAICRKALTTTQRTEYSSRERTIIMKRTSLQIRPRGFTLHLLFPLIVGVMLSIVLMPAPSAQAQKYSDWSTPVNLGSAINSASNEQESGSRRMV